MNICTLSPSPSPLSSFLSLSMCMVWGGGVSGWRPGDGKGEFCFTTQLYLLEKGFLTNFTFVVFG